jgi:hypothetical protein
MASYRLKRALWKRLREKLCICSVRQRSMSLMGGQFQTSARPCGMFGLPLIADIVGLHAQVRFVPAEIARWFAMKEPANRSGPMQFRGLF